MKNKKILLSFTLMLICLAGLYHAFAHSGRTDANGGHWNHSTGEYHYHTGKNADNREQEEQEKQKSDTSNNNGKVKFYDSVIVIILWVIPLSFLFVPLLVDFFRDLYYKYFNKRR